MAHLGITSCIHLNDHLVGEVNTKVEMVANNWFNFFLFFFLNKLRFCWHVTLISLESELETYGEINLKKSHKPVLWEKTMQEWTQKRKGESQTHHTFKTDGPSGINFLKTNVIEVFFYDGVLVAAAQQSESSVIYVSPPFSVSSPLGHQSIE